MAPAMSGPTKSLGRARPRGELHLLAVEQGQGHAGVERSGGDEEGQRHRLAGPGLAAEQQVALGQPDRDAVPVLVDPERERLPQRARRDGPRRGRATTSGSRRRIETWASEALAGSRTTRTSRAPDGGGQGLARLLDHLGGEPRRQAKAHPLSGGDQSLCPRSAGSGLGG